MKEEKCWTCEEIMIQVRSLVGRIRVIQVTCVTIRQSVDWILEVQINIHFGVERRTVMYSQITTISCLAVGLSASEGLIML
jgi:formate dehydrogenase assembly factor FdhD